MKFFVDTADHKAIADLAAMGLVDGVTTNPSLVKKSGEDFLPLIRSICALTDGPVSAEVRATDYDTMLKEGRKLAALADNVAVKVPLTADGLRVCRALREDGHQVNVTLCFSAPQAILAARAGATFVSPFVGRLDDMGADGMTLISDIMEIYEAYDYETQVLVASVRHRGHVHEAALLGAHAVTVPPAILWQMLEHPLTDKGLEAFVADWDASGQKIL